MACKYQPLVVVVVEAVVVVVDVVSGRRRGRQGRGGGRGRGHGVGHHVVNGRRRGHGGRDTRGLKGERESKLLGELDRGRIGRDGGRRLGQGRPVGVLHLAGLAGVLRGGTADLTGLKVVLGFAMPSALGMANSVDVTLRPRTPSRRSPTWRSFRRPRSSGGQADHVVGTDDESATLVGLVGQQ
jgi:hypothetical protein